MPPRDRKLLAESALLSRVAAEAGLRRNDRDEVDTSAKPIVDSEAD